MERTNALNPYAQPWVPMLEKVREEDRTIFFTFSRGHPVSNHQIAQFFTRYVFIQFLHLLETKGFAFIILGQKLRICSQHKPLDDLAS